MKRKEDSSVPLPETTATRLAYVFDLLSNIRGDSWQGDQTSDFAPSWVSSGTDPPAYIVANLRSLSPQHLLDSQDTFGQTVLWEKATLEPFISLSTLR